MEVLVVSKSFIVREALDGFFRGNFEDYNFRALRQLDEISNIDLSKVAFIFIDIENDIFDKISKIKEFFRNIKIVLFDKNNNNRMFLKAIKGSLDGYLVDIPEKEDLAYIVKRVLSGKKHYDVDLIEEVISNQYDNSNDNLRILTTRENEVLQMVGQGFSNKEIAKKLYITEHTIKKHITSILSKLDMRNRKDLIIYTKNKFDNK